jgi:multiple sugar transport system substrate-binding protein
LIASGGAAAATTRKVASSSFASAGSQSAINFLDLPYSTNTIPAYQSAATAFKKKTGIGVNVSQVSWDDALAKFLSLIDAHETPDLSVFGPKWLPQFIKLGVLEPLEPYLSKSFLANFPKSLLNQLTFDGHLWALPEALSTRLMYYRTDLFAKAGISAPPRTWTELLADAQKLDDPPKHYGLVIQGQGDEMIWWYTYFLYGAGGRYTNAAGQWAVNQPANVKALQFEADLERKYHVTQPDVAGTNLDPAQELLVKGQAAMYWGPPWILPTIQAQNPGLLKYIKVVDYPTVSGKPAPLFIQDVFVLWKGASDPEAVGKFLEFWNGDSYQAKFNQVESLIPVTVSVEKEPWMRDNKNLDRFVQSIPYALSYPVKDGWSAVNIEVDTAISQALLGTSAKTALDTAQAAIERQGY